MALALQEQLNMEESGGNAAAMAYQPGQPMAVAPAAMIGRLTGTHLNVVSQRRNSNIIDYTRGKSVLYFGFCFCMMN